jgi:hypothetical protein
MRSEPASSKSETDAVTNELPPKAVSERARLGRRILVPIAIGVLLIVYATGPGAESGSLSSSAAGVYPGWPGSGSVVTSDFVPVLVSADLGVGRTRVLVTLQDGDGRTIAAPDLSIELGFYDLAASAATAAGRTEGTFRWLIPDTRGIYTAPADFAHAGDWGVEVTGHRPGQPDRIGRATFSVRQTTQTPAIGAAAPPSDTLTGDDQSAVAKISTDLDPDPAFYPLSIRDAIAALKPFVVVFATPAFCESRACGPALELVKQVAPDYAGRVNFIHVEPYRLQSVGSGTQPVLDGLGRPQPVRAVVEWGLPTEPYVFVVDAHGKVAAKFEGEAYPDELRAALEAVLR